jgi:hypothetical protein
MRAVATASRIIGWACILTALFAKLAAEWRLALIVLGSVLAAAGLKLLAESRQS